MDRATYLHHCICLFLLMISTAHSYIYVYPPRETNLTREAFDDRAADFGHSIPESGIEGFLKEPVPRNACQPITPLDERALHDSYWFALVEESNSQKLCSFKMQAMHAQDACYTAIIVYNRNSNDLKTMRGDGPSIIAVFVSQFAGSELHRYTYKTRTQVYITRNPQLPLQFYLIPFAVVVGICFLFMLVFTAIRYIRFRRSVRKSRLSPANLKKIPTTKFKKGDEYDMCAICLDEYEEGEKLRVLPCSHVYHCKCVDPWLTAGKKVCPVCKRSVEPERRTPAQEHGEAGVSSSEDYREIQSSSESEEEDNETTPLLSTVQRQTPSGAVSV